jgi:hypothetical protein
MANCLGFGAFRKWAREYCAPRLSKLSGISAENAQLEQMNMLREFE